VFQIHLKTVKFKNDISLVDTPPPFPFPWYDSEKQTNKQTNENLSQTPGNYKDPQKHINTGKTTFTGRPLFKCMVKA